MTQENRDNFISDKELFIIAKETRDFEIRMFWQRTNYFLLLNSAIGAAFLFFLQKATGYNVPLHIGWIMLAFCIIGAFVCLAWSKICLGSKFWQVHWEQVLVELQPNVGLTGYRDIFSVKHIMDRVKENQKPRNERNNKNDDENKCWCDRLCAIGHFRWFDHRYNYCVLTKPSVSRWMYRTACFFFMVWIGAGIYSGCIIYKYAC